MQHSAGASRNLPKTDDNRFHNLSSQCSHGVSARAVPSEDLMREQMRIEEGLRDLKMLQLNEEAELEMEAKRKELAVRERRLYYEEQQRMYERRRTELAMQFGDYALSNPEDSVMSGNISNNLKTWLLNQKCQHWRFRNSMHAC